jgi:hypothetical protein
MVRSDRYFFIFSTGRKCGAKMRGKSTDEEKGKFSVDYFVRGVEIEERSFVALLLWMTANGGWVDE